MSDKVGARPADQALVSDEAATHLRPAGFDPSRLLEELQRRADRCRRQSHSNFIAPIIEAALLDVIASVRAATIQLESKEAAALKLALPILEAEYEQAKDMCDADWEGMSFTALSAVRNALGTRCDSDGRGAAGETGTGSTVGDSAGPEDIAHD